MAETVLHITRTGTLALEPDTALRYDDTRDVVAHTGEVLVYRAQCDGDGGRAYQVQMPLTADAEVTLLREFHTLQSLAEKVRGLPQVALAQQIGTINTALVMPVYDTLLSGVIQAHLTGGQFLLAERIALRAAIDYTAIVDSLHSLDPPRSCISHKTTDFFVQEGQVIVPGWHTLVDPTPEALASELSLFGQLWHALFLERYGTPPLYPFNDERWQTRDMPEGAMSIGLRVVMAAAIQSPLEQRFVDEQGRASHAILRNVLEAWQERLLQTPDELETLDAWALYGFIEKLPGTYTRPQINAIWQDLLWRVNRAAGLHSDALYTARTLAVNAARDTAADDDPYEHRQRVFKATGEYPVVIDRITSPEQLTQFKECVLRGEYSAAEWLFHQIVREASGVVERDWLARELEPYSRYIRFMLRYDDVAVLMTTPPPVVLTAAAAVLNDTRIDDKSGLHRVIVRCATLAFLRLEEAVRLKTWKAIQDAHAAYRAFAPHSRERAVIDRIRPLYPDALRFDGLDALLESYSAMHRTCTKLWLTAQLDPLRRITGVTQTAAMSRAQALETLALLDTAQTLGLEMSEIVESDEHTRRQWQRLIEEAMQALKQVDTVRSDIDSLRAGIDRVDTMAADVALLKTQVQGREDIPGLWQQVIDFEKRLSEVQYAPGDSRAKLTADLAELRRQVGTLEKEMRENATATARFINERIPRVDRLLDDVKERLEKLSNAWQRTAAYEGSLLTAYLDWVARQPDPENTEGVLEAVDELMYALRRCPVEAYTPALHEAWLLAFRRYQNLFADLTYFRTQGLRLRRHRQREAEEQRRALLEKLAACEAEANDRAEGHMGIYG